MTTWDDLTGTWDQMWTWDDPDRNMDLDNSFSMGEITVGSAVLTADWLGDVPTDLISPTQARDDFPLTILGSDSFTRVVANGIGADDQGTIYTTIGGSASDFAVNGSAAALGIGSLGVARRVGLPVLALNSDITMTIGIGATVTGAGGSAEQGIRSRFVDASNFTDVRIFRTVNTGAITAFVRQVVAGVETLSAVGNFASVPLAASLTVRLVTAGTALYVYAGLSTATLPTTPLCTLTGLTHLSAGTFEFYGQLSASITNSLPVTMTFDDLLLIDGDFRTTSVGSHPYSAMLTTSPQRMMKTRDGYASLRPEVVNAIAGMLVGDIVEANFDITIKARATSVFLGARGSLVIIARFQDSSNYLIFRLDFNTDQIMGYAMESVVGGSSTLIAAGLFPEIFHDVADWYIFRVQGIGSAIRLKAYDATRTPPRDWNATMSDFVYNTSPGKYGWGGYVFTGNTNPLPYVEFQVDEYWQGSNAALDVGQIAVGLSLDDGLPSDVTNTSAIGVNEATGQLLGPIGTSPDIFYSTFRVDQPYADLPRDVAGVAINAMVLGANGLRSVRLFTGRMADIPLDDTSAKVEAISSARLALSAPVQPPAVHGFFEGREATWLIGFILFQAGLYLAPRPLAGCRVYLPLNGTTHPYIPSTNSGAAALSGLVYSALGVSAYKAPAFINGPYTAAPDVVFNGTDSRKLIDGPGVFTYASFGPGDDFLSKAAYRGRIEAWVRLDGANIPASRNPSQSVLFRCRMRNAGSTRQASLEITSNRTLRGVVGDGTTTFQYPFGDLPVDGKWHFIALSWEMAPTSPQIRIVYDQRSLLYNTSLLNSNLGAVDDIERLEFDIAIPAVEIRLTSGSTAHKAQFANVQDFSPDAIMRRSLLKMDAVAETGPREAFEMLSAMAQGELAQIGFDAQDRFLYLPLPYWAEPEQQRVIETLSTDTNLGRKFRPEQNVHRIFNQISLSYKQTYVNEAWVTGFQTSQLIRIDTGTSVDLVAPMSVPIVEVRGLTLSVLSGAALAATPPSVTNAINYITLNTAQDGTGAYAAAADVRATIISWTPGAITVRIVNNSTNILFLSNNVSIPPLGLGVKQAIVADANVQASNSTSISKRGIRNLPVSLPVIQSDANALSIASALAGFLAEPRTTLMSDVWGDFRRTPGSLVLVRDLDGTGMNDSFRLTAITTTQDGADVQQAIAAVQAWPVQYWGSGNWGQGIWGSS